MLKRLLFGVALLALFTGTTARAGLMITVDELGHGVGTVGQGYIGDDPGPGGLKNVLIYKLPFAGEKGDVVVTEPPSGVGPLHTTDLIRFNGDFTLIFYSDKADSDGSPLSPADTDFPGEVYNLDATIGAQETGSEGGNGLFYTPDPPAPGPGETGTAGYDATFLPTYHIISDAPEPTALTLAIVGGLVLAGFHSARRARTWRAEWCCWRRPDATATASGKRV